MAKIQRVQRQVVANTVDPSAIGRAQAPFQQAAQVAGAFAQQAERVEIASAKAEVALANSQLNGKYRTAFNNNKSTFQNDPNGSSDAFNRTIDEITNDTMNGLTTDRAKQLFSQTSLQMKDGYTNKHIDWQDRQTKANVFKNLEETTNSTAVQAYEAGKASDFDAFMTNMQVSQDLIVASAGAVSPENIQKISDSSRKAQVDGFMDGMTRNNPVEALALIESGRIDDLVTPQEKDILTDKASNRIKNQAATQAKLLRDNPLEFLETQGAVVPEIELTDPQSFLDRAEFVTAQRTLNPNIDIPMFRPEEVKVLSRTIEKGNATEITGLLAQLNINAPEEFMDDMSEQLFNESPSYGVALSLIGQDPKTSRDIIRGQQLINEKAVEVPSDGQVVSAINAKLGSAIQDPQTIRQVSQAVKAGFAVSAFESGVDDTTSIEDNDEIFSKVLKNVVNDVATIHGSTAVTFRDIDNKIVSADEFKDAFDDLTDDSFSKVGQDLPYVGGEQVDADFIKEWGRLISVSDGKYNIHIRTENTYLTNAKGGRYVLDFKSIYNFTDTEIDTTGAPEVTTESLQDLF